MVCSVYITRKKISFYGIHPLVGTRNCPFLQLNFLGILRLFTICEKIIYGFGYDHVNDDYKVLRIAQFWDEVVDEVKVYNLKSNSWRRIKDFPYYLSYKRADGMLVNGALHWVLSYSTI